MLHVVDPPLQVLGGHAWIDHEPALKHDGTGVQAFINHVNGDAMHGHFSNRRCFEHTLVSIGAGEVGK